MIYLGDSARAPYGVRPIAEVRQYALACLDSLVDMGVKALVIACNTASAAVLADARERYEIPVFEVIIPAARRAVRISNSRRIAVLCTAATAKSGAYDDAVGAVSGVELTTVVCPRFVEFVEEGITGGSELLAVAQEYLEPVKESGADTVILGCTHYPLLSGVISYVLGDRVTLVSSAQECANAAYVSLAQQNLIRYQGFGHRRFLTTGNPERFAQISAKLLHRFVTGAEVVHELSEERVKVEP
jgi:glutamate racemase